jgi:hypothetical protein
MLEDVATEGHQLTAPAARWDRRRRLPVRAIAVVLAAAVTGVVGGYALRDGSSSVTVRVGRAVSTPYQIGAFTVQWSYAVPLHVTWRDVDGTWHEGSRPACLPPTGEIRYVTFGTVNVSGGGGPSYRQVVWVDCGAAGAAR